MQATHHYDPTLRDRLSATSDHPVVLNGKFADWSDQIEDSLWRRESRYGIRYRGPKEQELIHACEEHISQYAKPTTSDNVIGITHPFYLFLSQFDVLSDDTKPDAVEYLDKLMKLLHSDLPRKKVNLVLFETLHHYAAASSLLLEQGLVDQIVLTEYDHGNIFDGNEYDRDNLGILERKKMFMGGGYNGRCLGTTIHEIMNRFRITTGVGRDFFTIRDLILNPPGKKAITLKPSTIYRRSNIHLPEESAITLDQVLEMLEIKQPTSTI